LAAAGHHQAGEQQSFKTENRTENDRKGFLFVSEALFCLFLFQVLLLLFNALYIVIRYRENFFIMTGFLAPSKTLSRSRFEYRFLF